MTNEFPLVGPWEPSPINVAGVILRDHNDRILLQLRDINERTIGPGLWSFFGGHVEGDEDLKSAAVREFIEETGITLSKTSLTPVARAQSLEGAHLYAFAAKRTIDPSEIRLGEGAGFAFLTPDQLRALPLVPAAGAILHHFLDNIHKFP